MVAIPEIVRRRILALYGSEGESWLSRLPATLALICRRWELSLEEPYADLSYNFVVRGRRRDGTPVVLKIGVPNPELLSEIAALRHYGGRGCEQLLDEDADLGALLLERLQPGLMLVTLDDDDRATQIAAEVMQALWRPPPKQHNFPTTERWARGMQRLRATFDGGSGPFPPRLVAAAERLFHELHAAAHKPVLLHGDLHYYNILSAQRRPWLAIDPKGLSGEPLYETGALLRNPLPQVATWSDLRGTLSRRADILAECLEGDRRRILGWGMAQAVLSSWWTFEEELQPSSETLVIAEVLLDLFEESLSPA